MIGGIGIAISESVRNEVNLLMLHIDDIHDAACSVFTPHCIKYSSGFPVIINSGVVPPAIGCK